MQVVWFGFDFGVLSSAVLALGVWCGVECGFGVVSSAVLAWCQVWFDFDFSVLSSAVLALGFWRGRFKYINPLH